MVDRDFILEITVEVLKDVVFITTRIRQLTENIYEYIGAEFRLDGIAKGINVHCIGGRVAICEISVPKVH